MSLKLPDSVLIAWTDAIVGNKDRKTKLLRGSEQFLDFKYNNIEPGGSVSELGRIVNVIKRELKNKTDFLSQPGLAATPVRIGS